MYAKTKTPTNPENAIDFYKSARDEISSRMRMKYNTLLSSVIISATLIAVALQRDKYEILFCIPYLNLALTLLIVQIDFMIAKLSYYCACELGPYLRKNEKCAPQWDTSKTFHGVMRGYLLWVKLGSYLILLGLPTFVALYYNREHALHSPFPNVILWWLGIVCMLIISAALLINHIKRWCVYRHEEWKWANSNNHS